MDSQIKIHKIAEQVRSASQLCGRTRVVTIDGPAGSGKTSLAQELAEELDGCEIVHMDDMYAGWNQDLIFEFPNRIDSWILTPLQFNLAGHYLKYNWIKEQFDQVVTVDPTPYLILEGVGSGNPLLATKITFRIWIEANPDILLQRLIKRDGESLRNELVGWQKHELNYFNQAKVKEHSDLNVKGD